MKAMTEVFVFLIVCVCLAWVYEKSTFKEIATEDNIVFIYRRNSGTSSIIFVVLLIVMVCFAGLRTTMNDTATYLANFNTQIKASLSGIREIDWTIGYNPLFHIYQIIVKTFITKSGYGFLFVTSAVVVSSYLIFLRKYAVRFDFSVYLFISFTVYAFTMAAMKQTMATAIAIWSIPLWTENKRLQASILILCAMLIHPYVLLYFVALFLRDGIWNRKILITIIITLIAGAFFNTVVASLLNFTSALGDDYSLEWFSGGGISRTRLLVYMIVPFLSFIYKDKIIELNNPLYNLYVNLSIISTCFVYLASFGGANMFGRMANYFDIFHCLSIPLILDIGMAESRYRDLLKFGLIFVFLFFYYTYFSKYLGNGDCFYNHISLMKLFQNW